MSTDIFSKTTSEWASEAASLSAENKSLEALIEKLEEEAARLRDELGRAQEYLNRDELRKAVDGHAEAEAVIHIIANHPVVARCGSVLGGKSAQDLARAHLEK